MGAWEYFHLKIVHVRTHEAMIFYLFPSPLNINPPHCPILLIPPLHARAPSPNVRPKARDAHVAGVGLA